MSKELIVSASSQETKAAILEGGEVVEIHIEREAGQGDRRKHLQGSSDQGASGNAVGLCQYRSGKGCLPLCL